MNKSSDLKKELERLKQMRQKINKTEEITRIEDQYARERLRDMKQKDYEEFLDKKHHDDSNARKVDRQYVDGQVSLEQAKSQAEQRKREVDPFNKE